MAVKSTIERLLDRVTAITDACDLDLIVFFSRHPRTLIGSEDLARFVGYDLQRIARSLDSLIGAGIVRRSENHTHNHAHVARMYTLEGTGPAGGWLPSLLSVASTREGRAAIIAALAGRSPTGPTNARATGTDRVATRRLRVANA
jgi:hypothetical protein